VVDYCTYHSDCGWVGVQPLQHEIDGQDSALSSVATPAAPPDTTDTHTVGPGRSQRCQVLLKKLVRGFGLMRVKIFFFYA